MLAVIYGVIPRAKIENLSKAWPEKLFKIAKKPLVWFIKAWIAAVSYKGTGMCEAILNNNRTKNVNNNLSITVLLPNILFILSHI